MQLREFFQRDDAVSPVIGVILMVAITVILSAVIATFVLGLGEQVSDAAPQASFGFEYDDGNGDPGDLGGGTSGDGLLTIVKQSGQDIEASNLYVSGSSVLGSRTPFTENGAFGEDSKVTAGDELDVRMNSTDTVRVVWRNSQQTESATLADYEGPDA